ncbi:MAG: VOC family protein [Pseudomonadota bacterium]|nr:VOC family protein [Pseudomonadota bacterium]
MPILAASEAPCIFPTFRYRDAARMVDWLVEAFGFTVRARHANDDGSIAHAELVLGSSIIMLGSVRQDAYGKMVGGPGDNGGKSVYVAVDDSDAAYEQAKAHGAVILEGLVDRDYGSREFICRDPEGNVWSFGTYWPRASESAP